MDNDKWQKRWDEINKQLDEIRQGEPSTPMLNQHMNKLHTLIANLMQIIYESQDEDEKVILATLELRAREGMENIRGRLAIHN